VEWVETTGRSIDEAKEAALDRLGVDEPDAEFEILEEAKAGLFGRVRREARVRARIAPTRPREKQERRRRGRGDRNGGSRGGRSSKGKAEQNRGKRTPAGPKSNAPQTGAGADLAETADAGVTAAAPDTGAAKNGGEGNGRGDRSSSSSPNRNRRRRGGRGRGRSSAGNDTDAKTTTDTDGPDVGEQDMSEVSLEEQGDIVQDFLDGLVEAFDLDGEVRSEEIDEEMLEVQIVGDDLGLLIGPKGQTLAAVQELARTVVQRKAEGNPRGRFRVDVGGYRQRRREALERFTRTVADEVKASGVQKALEPMNASDRKVVHDTINEIDGVSTISEGEDPRRRVVILPAT
jgi:spoIIIJ-associated protein